MRQSIHLSSGWHALTENVVLTIVTGNSRRRIELTCDEAQHLSNRLQSFAKGNSGAETIIEKDV